TDNAAERTPPGKETGARVGDHALPSGTRGLQRAQRLLGRPLHDGLHVAEALRGLVGAEVADAPLHGDVDVVLADQDGGAVAGGDDLLLGEDQHRLAAVVELLLLDHLEVEDRLLLVGGVVVLEGVVVLGRLDRVGATVGGGVLHPQRSVEAAHLGAPAAAGGVVGDVLAAGGGAELLQQPLGQHGAGVLGRRVGGTARGGDVAAAAVVVVGRRGVLGLL